MATKAIDAQSAIKIINILKREERSREELIKYASKHFSKEVRSQLYFEFFKFEFSYTHRHRRTYQEISIKITVPEDYIKKIYMLKALQDVHSVEDFIKDEFDQEYKLLKIYMFGDVLTTETKTCFLKEADSATVSMYKDFVIFPKTSAQSPSEEPNPSAFSRPV